jgi:hypothetical protein
MLVCSKETMNTSLPFIVSFSHVTILSMIAFVILLIIPRMAYTVDLATFVYAYLPLPVLALWSYRLGESKKFLGSSTAFLFGTLCTFFLLDFMTPDKVEIIGETIIVRHAGPSLEQAFSFDSYIFPLIAMSITIKIYWLTLGKEFAKTKANNSLESTHEKA